MQNDVVTLQAASAIVRASAQPTPTSSTAAARGKGLLWTGRILSGLSVAFLAFDGAMKAAAVAPVVEASQKIGISPAAIRPIGAVLLLATLLFAIPRTAVLGALLVTAYLGGAVATMVIAGQPVYFPILTGIIVWAGLTMRRPNLRHFFLAA